MPASKPKQHAIVFADIVGSTQLYDAVGDALAKQLVIDLENEIARVVLEAGGQVVEIVGDEVMCRFDDVNVAVSATCRIQEEVDAYSMAVGKEMSVRIGLHFGPAIFEHGRMFGDSVNVAARMAAIAQGRQIITTEQVVDSLSADLKGLARRYDKVKVKGKQEKLIIYDLLWRHDNVTRLRAVPFATGDIARQLCLNYGSRAYMVPPAQSSFSMGRSPDNDLVVVGESVSRIHAVVEFSRGKCVLIDRSTNGTYVFTQDREFIYLRRESLPLWGSGQIGLGEPVSEENRHIVSYDAV
jgi:adenylate cyclase